MPRILWLAFERLPHPDAVSYPATVEDVRFVLELMSSPHPRRQQVAEQLRNFLKQQDKLPTFAKNRVPCRRHSGLYHLISWRLAKWLSLVLVADDAVIVRTEKEIRTWLEKNENSQIVAADAVAQK